MNKIDSTSNHLFSLISKLGQWIITEINLRNISNQFSMVLSPIYFSLIFLKHFLSFISFLKIKIARKQKMENGEDVPQDPLTGLVLFFKNFKDWEMGSKICVLWLCWSIVNIGWDDLWIVSLFQLFPILIY